MHGGRLMKRILLAATLAIAAAMVLFPPSAHAATITFTAVLSGASEIPPASSSGTGFTTVILDTTAQTMFVNVTFSELTSGTTASHIHCCLPAHFQTANEAVATQVP